MQLEVNLEGNRIATASCKAETTTESIKTKTESGNCFCIRFVLRIKLRLIVMSANLEYRARDPEDREKERVGGRPAKLNEKKGDRDLEREIQIRETFFCWKNNMKILWRR